MWRRGSPASTMFLLAVGVLGLIGQCQAVVPPDFFNGTCPPPEAVIESNGEAVIEVNVTSGSDTAVITWTDPTGSGVQMQYACFPEPAGTPPNYECDNGDAFPISYTLDEYQRRILVTYTVYTSIVPTVVKDECDFYLRVLDPIPPEITCPSDVGAPAGMGLINGTANWTEPVGTDNSGQVTTVSSHSPPLVLDIGSHVVTYTATDSSENKASCSFNVIVIDMTPPEIECPLNIDTETDPLQNFANVTWHAPNVTDNSVDDITPMLTAMSGSVFEIGSHTVDVTATDSQNNTGMCSFNITVRDQEPPVITCSINMTVPTDPGVDNVTLPLPNIASANDNSGTYNVKIEIAGIQYSVGDSVTLHLAADKYVLQYIVCDDHGNSESCNTSINVVDEEVPMITCPPALFNLTDPGLPTANVSFPQATAWDNSMLSVRVMANATSDSPFNIGETVVQFIGEDNSENTNDCFFTITVIDDEDPEIECPMDIEVPTDPGVDYANVTWFPPNVTDNSGETITPALSHDSGDPFPLGPTLVTVNAIDSSSNVGSCNFTVNVIDMESPMITCPDNQTNSTDLNLDTVRLALPAPASASDNSGVFNISIDVDGSSYSVGDSVSLDLATGQHLLQYTITDNAGLSDTCDMYITVIDDEDPRITCPASVTFGTDPGLDTANVTWQLATVVDNSNVSIIPVSDPESGSVLPIGDTTVQFNATDESGNTASCTFVVTVEDMEPPVINCSNLTFSTSPGLPTAFVTYTEPDATDNVDLMLVACFNVMSSGEVLGVGTYQVDCVATDTAAEGLTDSCSLFITVEDNETPNITCPANETVFTDGHADFATFTLPVPDSVVDNSGNYTVSVDVAGVQHVIGDNVTLSLATGVHEVQYTATDPYMNSEMCDMIVTVIDDEDPRITCPASVTFGTDPGLDTANATWQLATVVDNSNVSIIPVSDPESGSILPIGNTTVQFNATDESGNTASCTFVVTVEDDEDPEIECPMDIEMAADPGVDYANVTWFPPNVTDNSGETITPALSHDSGDPFPLGPTLVTVNAIDSNSNSGSCNFTVNVIDEERPMITCPDNQTNSTDLNLDTVRLALPAPASASDNSGVFNISIDVDGSSYSVGDSVSLDLATGQYLLQYTITDNAGLSDTCDMYITVIDDEDPRITCPASVTFGTDPGLDTANVTWELATVVDNSNVSIIPVSDPESGSVLPIGDTTVQFNATDESGNTASCTFVVTVEDMEPPVINCSNLTFSTSPGLPTAFVTYTEPDATDNVDLMLVACFNVMSSGEVLGVGTYQVDCVATDTAAEGLTDSCSLFITVEDNETPNITCPANETVFTDGHADFATFTLPVPDSVVDNSGNYTVSVDVAGVQHVIGDNVTLSLATGVHEVQYTATDPYMNSEMCDMIVTVIDAEVPRITCPASVTFGTDPGLDTANVTWELATVVDNSNVSIIPVGDPESGSVLPIGNTTVQFNATDESGNTASCTFVVTVEDDEDPEIECPMDIEMATDPGVDYANVTWFSPNVTDNSGETITPALSHDSGDPFPLGPTLVIVNATDSNSNMGSCNFTVNVIDMERPMITCPDNQTNSTDLNLDTVRLALPAPASASDNSGVFNISIDVDGSSYSVGDSVSLDLATGQHLLQYTITDNAGLSDMCDMYITVIDDEDPRITCPASVTFGTDPGLDTANATWELATVVDNSNVSIIPVSDPESGSILPIGNTTVQFNATDESGNTASCTFVVTVEDDEDPEIECPMDIEMAADPGVDYANVTWFPPNVTDNSGETITPALSHDSGDPFPLGPTLVTVNAIDSNSNSGSCNFTVNVIDEERPMITCPDNQTNSTDLNLDTVRLALPAPASASDNSGVFNISIDVDGSSYSVGDSVSLDLATGQYLLQYTITDNAGLSDTCDMYITVIDDEDPRITCPASVTFGTDPGLDTANVTWQLATVVDNSNVSIIPVSDPESGSVLPIGDTTVQFNATDESGNTASCTFVVTVEDMEPPVINCSNLTFSTSPGLPTAFVTYTEPDATDNVDLMLVACFNVMSSGEVLGVGTYQVDCVATDTAAEGLTDSCSLFITVEDNETPNITCPANETVSTDGHADFATFTLPVPDSVVDNSGNYTVSVDVAGVQHVIGDNVTLSLATGVHEVQYTATDPYMNSEMCDMIVTVIDAEVPRITCPASVTFGTDPGLDTANVTWELATVVDNSNVSIIPVGDPESGSVLPIGNTTVQFNATDESGNTASCTFVVTVEDDEDPEIECPMDIEMATDPGVDYANVTWFSPNVTDNSGETITPALSHDSGDPFPLGPTLVIVNATDSNSNMGSCNFTVNVIDMERPMITCPDNQTNSTDLNLDTVRLALPAPASASDNSGVFNISIDVDGSSYSVGDSVSLDLATGQHLLQYTITDNAGLSDMCDMYITVIDDEDPRITCPASVTFGTDPGLDTANATWELATVVDNSNVSIIPVGDPESGSVLPIGDTTVQFNATDESGNTASCTFVVTVEDDEDPEIECPMDIEMAADPGVDYANVTWFSPNVTDNSGETITPALSHDSGDPFPLGPTLVTVNAIDSSSNMGSCNFTVNVIDMEPPMITCQDNQTNSTDLNLDTVRLALPAPASASDNSGVFNISIVVDGSSYSVGDSVSFDLATGQHLLQYTITDNAGLSDMCDMYITVIDEQAPDLMCPGYQLVVVPDGQPDAAVTWPPPMVADNSGEVPEAFPSRENGTVVPINEETTIIYNATDSAGNVGYCNFSLLVIDNVAPVITCPDNVTAPTSLYNSYGPVTWDQPLVTDNVPATVTVRSDYVNGSNFDLGDTIVTLTATDAVGNNNTCQFTITVIDNQAPNVTFCPANINQETDTGLATAVVTFSQPTATDIDGIPIMAVGSHSSNSMFTIGETDVSYTFTDSSGNVAYCNFTVTVNDDEDPVLDNCQTNVTLIVPRGSSQLSTSWPFPTATDNAGQPTVFNATYTEVDVDNQSSVTVTIDWQAGFVTVSQFYIGHYRRVIRAEDADGNSVECVTEVWILVFVDTIPPVISNCPVNISRPTDAGQATAAVTWTIPTATDDQGDVTLTSDFPPATNFSIGMTDVTYTATDGTNQVNCTFTVTVTDEENPTLANCPMSFSLTAAQATGQVNASWTPPTASDNSGMVTRTTTMEPGQSLSPGQYPVTYTATDPAGLMDTCTFTVTVDPFPACNSNPCSNGGTCNPTSNNGFTCSCTALWMGATCDEVPACNSDPCSNGGTCNPTSNNGFTCSCTAFWTGATCGEDVNECTSSLSPCSGNLFCSNRQDPVGYICDCPVGFVRAGNSDNCIRARMFRFRITIVEINGDTAVFLTDLGNSNTAIFLFHQTRLETVLIVVFSGLPGFRSVVVLFFFRGSIVVEGVVSFDPDSSVTMADVNNALQQRSTTGDLLDGSEYKVEPSASFVIEEVCADGYCQNGGTCTASAGSYLSTCTCPSGYVGARCEDVTVTTPAPGGGDLSTEAIVAIAVGVVVAFLLILLMSLAVCCLMMRGRGRRRGYLYREDYEGQRGPKRHINSMYDVRFHPENNGFMPSTEEFTVPYMATGRNVGIPLHRLAMRGDADFY